MRQSTVQWCCLIWQIYWIKGGVPTEKSREKIPDFSLINPSPRDKFPWRTFTSDPVNAV